MAGIRWGGGRERETQWDEDKYIRLGAMAHWAWLSKCDRCRAKCAGERLPVATFPRILDHVCTVHVVCEMVRRGQIRSVPTVCTLYFSVFVLGTYYESGIKTLICLETSLSSSSW